MVLSILIVQRTPRRRITNCNQQQNLLGNWMTRTGVKPIKKKIKAALKIEQPQNQTQVRSILRRIYVLSNIIAPKVVWTERHTKSFSKNNLIGRSDEYLSRSQSSNDSRDYQLGAAILQNNKPVVYWSNKVTK